MILVKAEPFFKLTYNVLLERNILEVFDPDIGKYRNASNVEVYLWEALYKRKVTE